MTSTKPDLLPSALGTLRKAPRDHHPSSPSTESAAEQPERTVPAGTEGEDVGQQKTEDTPTRPRVRVGPGKTRRTYYLSEALVEDLDRKVSQARTDAYVDREPSKNEVYEAVIRAGLDQMPDVIERLRSQQDGERR